MADTSTELRELANEIDYAATVAPTNLFLELAKIATRLRQLADKETP